MKTGVGVEKLFPAKSAKIKSCQDAPQTTFSVFLDIFYPPNSCCFEENGVFQQPQTITPTTCPHPKSCGGSECYGDLSPVETIAVGLDYFRLADKPSPIGLWTLCLSSS
jgi:hypothetical protein